LPTIQIKPANGLSSQTAPLQVLKAHTPLNQSSRLNS